MLWAANEALFGTWKLNLAKSKVLGPAPKSRIMKIEAAGSSIKVTVDEMDAQGKPNSRAYTANFDGKDVGNPIAPDRDTISWKQIDARTWETTSKQAGKVTATSKRVLSPDGKVFTLTTTSRDAQGRPVIAVMVYEKQ
jgi:hypothetical protein